MTRRDERLYAVALSLLAAPATLALHERADVSPSDLYRELERSRPLSVQEHMVKQYSADPVEAAGRVLDRIGRLGARALTLWDSDYPAMLREISRPPLALYLIGETVPHECVAVVGTRNAEQSARATARRMCFELARAGFTVVSGLAAGIDREAHLGALDAGGATIGVLAGGIDMFYPSQNSDLKRMILASPGSGLISEHPPRIFAGKWGFAKRNRIISGLSRATVVVQAGEKSGALITARYALEQNREVFACPGRAYESSYAGCHNLIRSGAVLASSADDVIREILPIRGIPPSVQMPARSESAGTGHSPEQAAFSPGSLEAQIMALLEAGTVETDEIIRRLAMPPGEVSQAITVMELAGAVTRSGNRVMALR
jgi:DNA processing protein